METKSLPSAGGSKLRVTVWSPEGAPVGIVQLVHGIAEHSGRYAEFAEFLMSKGYLVVSEDHMGHGGSVSKVHPLGCIKGGWDAMAADVSALSALLRRQYPELPLFLLGHSMGSFLARTCLYEQVDAAYAGCILSGTAWQPRGVLKTGIALAKGEIHRHGEHEASPSLKNLMFGSYLRGLKDVQSPNDWISSVRASVDEYDADPLCGFTPSGGLVLAMLEGLLRNQQKDNLLKMPKALPVLFIAGRDDPVGNRGRGVVKSEKAFRRAGMQNVERKLYPNARHEVLGESCRAQVWSDVLEWLEARRVSV